MGVIMGKIIMNNTENQTQLILQAGDEESLKKQVDGIDMLERKANAWDSYITEVRERVRFTENTEDAIERETQKVIDYYMEADNDY